MTGHINHASIKFTRAVKSLSAFAGDCYREEFGDDKSHQREFARRLAEHFAGLVGCEVVEKRAAKPPTAASKRIAIVPVESPVAREAIELAEEIIGIAESGDVPSAGIDFAESVAGRARDIMETVESSKRATSGQIAALENMLDGLKRWLVDME